MWHDTANCRETPNDTASHARRAALLDCERLMYFENFKPIQHKQCFLFGAKGGSCVSCAVLKTFTIYLKRLTFVIMAPFVFYGVVFVSLSTVKRLTDFCILNYLCLFLISVEQDDTKFRAPAPNISCLRAPSFKIIVTCHLYVCNRHNEFLPKRN
jgi:hypothetical protein